MSVGEERIRGAGQLPKLGRAAEWTWLFRESDQPFLLERVQMLAHRHGRDVELLGERLSVLRLELQQIHDRTSGGSGGLHFL